MQVGGGITADNAKEFINEGASHVIVTSYVFKDGKISYENMEKLVNAVGRDKVVLDMSCRKKDDRYYVVTDRWQVFTEEEITPEFLDSIAQYCDELLVHAADVEGKSAGIEEELVKILGDWGKIPLCRWNQRL